MPLTSDWVRVKEAAELLGVSTNTVRAWGASGKIPEYRHPVNNYRIYKREELEELMSVAPEPPRSAPAPKRAK
jgi:DNA (cytosine-5)-methyltransferase 1